MIKLRGLSPAFFPSKKKNDAAALCIVNIVYVIGPPLQHRVLQLANLGSVGDYVIGSPAGEHFLRPECSTWLYSLG